MSKESAYCAHCEKSAKLTDGKDIYPHRKDLHEKRFWKCEPCRAYVGCHRAGVGHGDGTRPMGRPANAELRRARGKLHQKLDPIWKNAGKNRNRMRGKVYKMLGKKMGLAKNHTHIAHFNLEQCREAWVALDHVMADIDASDDAPLVSVEH